VLCLKLVIQRFRIVIVYQDETLPWLEVFEGPKDERVPLSWWGLADINYLTLRLIHNNSSLG
jgi:hypothetical protein